MNRALLFYLDQDYRVYRELLIEGCRRFEIRVFHYCFLSNHTHILFHSPEISQLSRLAHFLHRRYAIYLCKTHQLAEQVFKKHFVSVPIEDDVYLLECARYIERNPVRAGIVKNAADYQYSSYCYYAKGDAEDLVEKNPLYDDLGSNAHERMAAYRAYIQSPRLIEAAAQPFPF